jgi:hypothetical protein
MHASSISQEHPDHKAQIQRAAQENAAHPFVCIPSATLQKLMTSADIRP